MARVAHLDHPLRPHLAGSGTAVGAVLSLLRAVDSIALKATAALRHAWAQRQALRRQREEDRKLWEVACADTRVMADLVALSQATSRAWPPLG